MLKATSNQTRRSKRLSRGIGGIFLAAAIVCYLLFLVERQIRPILLSIVQYECRRYALNAFGEAADESMAAFPESYQGLYDLQYAPDGSIAAVTVNSYAVNRLQAELSSALTRKLAEAEQTPLTVPLGTLVGLQLLVGRGPLLELKVLPESYVETEVYSMLEDAGINQTKLCLYVRFAMNMSVIMSGYSAAVEVTNDQYLGEVLLVGQTPQAYHGGLTAGG